MIAYIKGPLSFKSPTNVIIDINGVGYHINISLFTYSKLEQLEEVKLLTHLMIKEDSHGLYGFFDKTEKNLFLQLISVSGIGATTAQLVLSALNPDQVKTAIIQDQDSTFSKVKGIGPKTAKRIILDLKDKISKEPVNLTTNLGVANNTIKEEALFALLALGFLRPAANQVLQKILQEEPDVKSVAVLIKKALSRLS